MIIQKVRVERFGCLTDIDIEFQPGLNVIRGPNEAGKSTLQQAIFMALFERPTKKKTTQAFQSWGHHRLYTLEVSFADRDGNPWRLVKDFENNHTQLTNGSGEQSTEFQDVSDRLSQFLGTSSDKMFRSTVFMAQDGMTEIDSGKSEISRSLERIITGGEQDTYTQQAIDKLDKAIRSYGKGYLTKTYVNMGPIAELEQRKNDLTRKNSTTRQQLTGREQKHEELESAQSRIEEIESDLKTKQALLQAVERVDSTRTELETWRKQEEEMGRTIQRVQQAQNEVQDAHEAMTPFGALAMLSDTDRQRLLAWESDRQALVERLSEASPVVHTPEPEYIPTPVAEVRSQKTEKSKISSGIRRLVSVVIVAVGFAAVGVGLLVLNQLLLQVVSIGFGAILVLLGLLLISWPAKREDAITLQTAPVGPLLPKPVVAAPMIPVDPTRPLEEAKLVALQTQIQTQLQALGCVNWADYQNRVYELNRVSNYVSVAETKISTLLNDGKTLESLEMERKTLSRKRKDLEEDLDEPDLRNAAQIQPLQYQSLKSEIDSLSRENGKLQRQVISLETIYKSVTVSREELLQAEETLAGIEADLERAKHRLASYQLAHTCMVQARTETLVRAQDQLAPQMAKYIEILSLGKYTRVEVGTNLEIAVASLQESERFIKPSALSKGARDQVYLAARLALTDLLFPDVLPPLFLDDPFVAFDPERRQAAAKLCIQIAQNRQVFLFTCHHEYDELGHLIVLPQGAK